MEPLLPFKEAMRLAWVEYREAKVDVMTSISNGKADGELWQQKLLRLETAIDTLGCLPRTYFGEN